MNTKNFGKELMFKTSRSSGKGGQHVNKVATKVELIFNVNTSIVLDKNEKRLLRKALKNRISKDGNLHLVCQTTRSQLKNKYLVVQKFEQLIAAALTPKKERIASATPKWIKAKRLKNKRLQSEKKAQRQKVNFNSRVDPSRFLLN